MDFTEVVGFLVTMAAIVYMFVKRAQDRQKSSHTHEEGREEHEQEANLKEFLKSLEIDMEESEDFKPLPKPKVVTSVPPTVPQRAPKPKSIYKHGPVEEEFKFRSDLDDFKTRTNIEERKLKVGIKNKFEGDYGEHLLSAEFRGDKMPTLIGYKRPSRIQRLIHSLPSKKDIVLLHEVLDKPKGFKF